MYGLVLKNCSVIDGTGAPAFRGDICIANGKIAEICESYDGEFAELIDCEGLVVAPGFIDIHSHSDVCPFGDYFPDSKVLQGVTTELCGNCGVSAIGISQNNRRANVKAIWELFETKIGSNGDGCFESLADYKAAVEKVGYPSNIAMLAGHGPLRNAVLGSANREPNAKELETMKAVLEKLLKEGAFGLSYGLIYPPGSFSKADELRALAAVCARNDALVSVHMRSEGKKIFEALEEMLSVTHDTGVRLELSHIKILTKELWDKSSEIIARIERARAEGVNVHCDQYPFTATNTVIAALLPHETLAGGIVATILRLIFPTKKLLCGIDEMIEERGGPDAVLLSQTGGKYPEYVGKTLKEISNISGISPAKLVVKLVRTTFSNSRAFYFSISEKDMLNFMRQPYVCVGSDGAAYSFDHTGDLIPHPRNLCTYPEYIRKVQSAGILPLEEAIRRMTSLPAEIIGLQNRGVLRVGASADITVFDPNAVRGKDLYKKAPGKPEGIEYVIVNGVLAVEKGETTGRKPGIVLLRETAQAK